MISLRRPPTFMPGTPSFQPSITGVQSPDADWVFTRIAQSSPRPAWRLLSNRVPSVSQPLYCTDTVAPLGTVRPVPTLRSRTWRLSGNLAYVLPSPSWKLSAVTTGVGVVAATPAAWPLVRVGSG